MLRAAILAALLAFAAMPAAAQDSTERITNYASDINVTRNGGLTVTETITVMVQDEQIRHGIFRDFPTTYTGKFGRRVRVDFTVLRVTRDGFNEPYDLGSIDSGERIKIGDANVTLPPGLHTYTITYATGRQIGFFDKYDELYWNVTGNFWQFAIDQAEATVHLPPGAHILQSAYYTGAAGARGENATSENLSDSVIHFRTTEALQPNEGLTVAVGFNKGVVLPPSAAEQRADFIRDNASMIVALAGVLMLLVYFGVTWWSFGRDPARGTIIPLFAAPKDLSPAAVRYVHRMEYDRKAYAASLIDMAVKGYLTIAEDDGDYTLTRTGKSEEECGFDTCEHAIAIRLFNEDRNSIEMKQANHSDIAASISGLKTALHNQYEANYFVTNLHWFIGGVAILAITALAAALLSENNSATSFMLIWMSGWSIGTAVLVHRAWNAWASVIAGPGSRILNFFSALFVSAFALPFAGGLIFVLVMFGGQISLPASFALIIGGIACYVFYHLLKAPTLAGAKIRDQIDGFRIFLNTAEKDRLEKLNPPNVTPAVFEKFLPYAIALDCENQWSKRFEAEAAAAGSVPSAGAAYGGYVPIWYSGRSFSSFGAAGFASALGASLAASAASAATAPGSSSGSGGGGFSGGGGGGGGGGGW
jgi:uncharacterized membrane protein YgcG